MSRQEKRKSVVINKKEVMLYDWQFEAVLWVLAFAVAAILVMIVVLWKITVPILGILAIVDFVLKRSGRVGIVTIERTKEKDGSTASGVEIRGHPFQRRD